MTMLRYVLRVPLLSTRACSTFVVRAEDPVDALTRVRAHVARLGDEILFEPAPTAELAPDGALCACNDLDDWEGVA